jgi:hypothetical protein
VKTCSCNLTRTLRRKGRKGKLSNYREIPGFNQNRGRSCMETSGGWRRGQGWGRQPIGIVGERPHTCSWMLWRLRCPPRVHETAVCSPAMAASTFIDHVMLGELQEKGPNGGACCRRELTRCSAGEWKLYRTGGHRWRGGSPWGERQGCRCVSGRSMGGEKGEWDDETTRQSGVGGCWSSATQTEDVAYLEAVQATAE